MVKWAQIDKYLCRSCIANVGNNVIRVPLAMSVKYKPGLGPKSRIKIESEGKILMAKF